jgi:allophycocyanin-B
MSIVKQMILNADEEVRYLTPGEIHALQNFYRSGTERIRLAKVLAQNEKRLSNERRKNFGRSAPELPVIAVTPVKLRQPCGISGGTSVW